MNHVFTLALTVLYHTYFENNLTERAMCNDLDTTSQRLEKCIIRTIFQEPIAIGSNSLCLGLYIFCFLLSKIDVSIYVYVL